MQLLLYSLAWILGGLLLFEVFGVRDMNFDHPRIAVVLWFLLYPVLIILALAYSLFFSDGGRS